MRYRALRLSHFFILAIGAGLWVGCSTPSTPAPVDAPKPSDAGTPGGGPVPAVSGGQPTVGDAAGRKTVAAYLTRCGGIPYRAIRYFEGHPIPFSKVPGADEVSARIALTGQPIPGNVVCVDRLTETLLDNMGLAVHSMGLFRSYIDPIQGQSVAFDLLNTSGGVPQRCVGHRTKNGCHMVFYRGTQQEEEKDLDFAPGVEIFPLTLDFIHLFFVQHKERKELIRSLFVPEILGFAELSATPEGNETVALGGRNYECAKYLVRTGSSRAREGVTARQYLWFDVHRGVLLKRVDVQSQEGFETVVERVEPERLNTLTPLVVRPGKMVAGRPFPYPLGKELVYRVQTGDQRLGEIRVSFTKRAADANGPEGWQSKASVSLSMKNDQGTNTRQEEAVTRFDAGFHPLDYQVTGRESAGVSADYTIGSEFADGTVSLRVRREVRPQDVVPPPVAPDAKTPVAAAAWDEPLQRISLSGEDQETAATAPRFQNERYSRPLSAGVFAFDYHRVEHLAVALYRLPLPARAKDGAKAPGDTDQTLAFYAVRQNMSSLVPFSVLLEPRATSAAPTEPDIYVVSTSSLLMPGSMLVDGLGRVLQWTTRYGTQEIVYTLDDPIMQKRERRLEQAPAQDGPLLLRPPWY